MSRVQTSTHHQKTCEYERKHAVVEEKADWLAVGLSLMPSDGEADVQCSSKVAI